MTGVRDLRDNADQRGTRNLVLSVNANAPVSNATADTRSTAIRVVS